MKTEQKKMLLSIHERWARLIYAGVKKYEVRRQWPRDFEGEVYLYETAPTKSVRGGMTVGQALRLSPAEMTPEQVEGTQLSYGALCDYAGGEFEPLFLVPIESSKEYLLGSPLSHYGVQAAPQSYVYVS